MCGISGLANCGDQETLARMTAIQAHRGPDDSGLWEQRFSRRLLFRPGQPPACDSRSFSRRPYAHVQSARAVCGSPTTEKFTTSANYATSCKARDTSSFRKRDTEVVLHLYEEEGPDCVKRLNGMFAFAICDLRSGAPRLFMARDHFGVKPFYYAHQGRPLCLRF